MSMILTYTAPIKQNNQITSWNDCALLGKFVSDELPTWEQFFEDRKEDNRLLVYFVFNKLDASDRKKAAKTINAQTIYKKRVHGIKADMTKLGCSSPDEYISRTNQQMLEIKNFYDSLVSDLRQSNGYRIF